jgi:hypothetical protein
LRWLGNRIVENLRFFEKRLSICDWNSVLYECDYCMIPPLSDNPPCSRSNCQHQ